ncbi:MAG: bifunctional alpha,alpha-trehalose-phosphate synthase (UDP-forming)/trehalose-phosphatase, partial [bacterium]|nr:bifunctional alpha,alpha-trehalose-phosphate synthase (UDP-forming)/trehalose-phosphatase [bacterium]
DLIGFHTHDYTRYFLTCVHRILGQDHNMGEIVSGGRLVKADAYPMVIDYDLFSGDAKDAAVRAVTGKLKKNLNNLKVILSVDRLDYTKGVLNRLRGYEIFLEKYPEWAGKAVLLLVVVSSRIGVDQYQQMKRQIDEAVGRINGKWGKVGWSPVVYQYRHLSFGSLAALYNISDVCLVTPLRDGMNLIAKEYLASRADNGGVLVLSEMAGAAKELGEAVLINPNDREEIADALSEALAMPPEEQKRRNSVMQKRLQRCTVARWAGHFLNDTAGMKTKQKKMGARLLSSSALEKMMRDFGQSGNRLIFLDYDGTLVPFSKDPRAAVPPKNLLETLKTLCALPQNHVVLISGRDKTTLHGWFGDLPIHLVAEHGIWMREKGEGWALIKPLLNDWKEKLLPLLDVYCDRVPGSLVEEKDFSVTWHYRGADPELSSLRAKELVDDLTAYTANIDLNIFQGNRVVEIRSGGVNKGTAGIHFYSRFSPDFSLAIGDDTTDEDLFRALPESVYTVRVGMVDSHAKYNLKDHTEVISILNQLGSLPVSS